VIEPEKSPPKRSFGGQTRFIFSGAKLEQMRDAIPAGTAITHPDEDSDAPPATLAYPYPFNQQKSWAARLDSHPKYRLVTTPQHPMSISEQCERLILYAHVACIGYKIKYIEYIAHYIEVISCHQAMKSPALQSRTKARIINALS
jgi:hypothetical protein